MKRSSGKCISAFRTRIFFVLYHSKKFISITLFEVKENYYPHLNQYPKYTIQDPIGIVTKFSHGSYRRKISILLRPRYCFIFTGCYKYVPIVMMRLLIFLRNLYHIFPRMLSVSDAIILILKLLSTHGVLNMLFMPQKEEHF